MYLQRLLLKDFRNYTILDRVFSPGLNVIFGPNAAGKTNILEGIHLLATGQSSRAARDAELIRWGQPAYYVRGEAVTEGGTITVDLGYAAERRKAVKVNGMPQSRLGDLLGNITVVYFSPDDLQLVKGSPGQRRRFLDIEISQVSPQYYFHLVRYNQVLSQRNVLLRSLQEGRGSPADLDVWDEQIAGLATRISSQRQAAVASMSARAAEIHQELTSGGEHLLLQYVISAGTRSGTGAPAGPADFLAVLRRSRGEEIRRGMTVVGPHRDDLLFLVNGRDARACASQGQQRTAVLAVKLAELAFMRDQTGRPPILLLDDVLSELDGDRRQALLSALGNGTQAFVTCTDGEDLMRAIRGKASYFKAGGGLLEPLPVETRVEDDDVIAG